MVFHFIEKDIKDVVESMDFYDNSIKKRVINILTKQRQKYQYFFQ